jgi:disulfide bond formation protein DsbB
MKSVPRLLFLFVFLACAGLLGYALYLQEVKGLSPCSLCVVQRIAYWLIGLTALLGFLHNPQAAGRRVYGGLLALFALAGAVVALRHSWLVRHPGAIECGISPEEQFLNALPLAQWWPAMFEASGDCARIRWKFLSLAIPDWSLVWFAIFLGVAVYIFLAGKKRRRWR